VYVNIACIYNLWKTRRNLYDISDKFVFHVIVLNLDLFKALYTFCKRILFKNSFSLKNLLFFFPNKSLRDPLRRISGSILLAVFVLRKKIPVQAHLKELFNQRHFHIW